MYVGRTTIICTELTAKWPSDINVLGWTKYSGKIIAAFFHKWFTTTGNNKKA